MGEFKATIRCLVETILPVKAVAIIFKSEDVVGVSRSKGKKGGKICGMNSLDKGPVDAGRIKKIG